MQDVNVEVLVTGLCICHSVYCRFKYKCANHTTAGNFRIENGFTPKLFKRVPEVWACHTIDDEVVKNTSLLGNAFPKTKLRNSALLADGSRHAENPDRLHQWIRDWIRNHS